MGKVWVAGHGSALAWHQEGPGAVTTAGFGAAPAPPFCLTFA